MSVSPRELLKRHGIDYVETKKGAYTTNCPNCSGGYLNVKIDHRGVAWFCHNCDWGGPKPRKGDNADDNDLGPIKAIYDYTDEAGERLYQVLRFEPLNAPKTFRQRKGPDQKRWSIRGVRIVPFRLHELIKELAAGRTIFVVEGEKDVITLRQHGIAATCNPMGAGKWRPEFNQTLKGADVVICGDNDEPGREHVMLVAANLHGVARRLRVLDLATFWPEIQASDDITDWFAAGGTAERLWEMVEQLSPPKDPLACVEAEASGDEENRAEHARTSARRGLLPPPSMPMLVARVFVADHCTFDGELTLRHWRGGWWRWRSSHWREVPDRGVRSLLYAFTEEALYLEEGALAPWAPNRKKIGDLFEALAAICILSDDTDQPCWLDDPASSGSVIVAMANGLLDVDKQQLLMHTPLYFNQVAVPFDYDPTAPSPRRWHGFLDELWPSEPEAIDAMGEWLGYVISGRTDLHKIFLHVGPTRGGKGVIARIESALVGRQNVAGPTLNSLGGEFGLAPLIGKSLAIISDARFSGRDSSVVVERLLSISGEDTLTVNRKYRDQWTGKLPTRIHVISNELPKLGDASTAIVGRIVLLLSSRSWLGREDLDLEPALQAELPGILNFALEGLQRLCNNDNRFTHVAAADEAIIQMRDLASPVAAFVREKCELGADKQIDVDVLYTAYKQWAEDNGHVKMSKSLFGRDLRAAHPPIRKTRPRDKTGEDDRHHVYAGIALQKGERKAA
jgi:putative DNA primase/helicase